MKNILCYGDSNTFGYIPKCGERYNVNERWTSLLQKKLGNEYNIIEEGLCGRTTIIDDPIKSGRNGKEYIEIALESHKPLDLVIICLGTNDLKVKFSQTSNSIAKGIQNLIQIVKNYNYSIKHKIPEILILSPAPLGDKVTIVNKLVDFDNNSIIISKELAEKYKYISEIEQTYFLDLGNIVKVSEEDQIHFSKESHKVIAEELTLFLKNKIKI